MFHLILDQFISCQNDDIFYFPLFNVCISVSTIRFVKKWAVSAPSAGHPLQCEGTLSVSWAQMELSPGSPGRVGGVRKTYKFKKIELCILAMKPGFWNAY